MSHSYAIGAAPAAVDGQLTVAASTSVTGWTSSRQMQAGDYLTISGETRRLTAITYIPNLSLWEVSAAVDVAYTIVAISAPATYARLYNLETSLKLTAPRGVYTPYSQPVTLGSGLVRGAGWATAEWRWGFLGRTQRDILRAYCPGASAEVNISTRTTDSADAYGLFAAVLVWPQQEEPEAGRRLDFTIKFQRLIPWL